jgi:glutamate racemase
MSSFFPDLTLPIGVFDSGVGGLTVLNALREKLPASNFLYFADTARVPYGRKPPGMVRDFAFQIMEFLLQQNASHIVVACNTACAAALPELIRHSPVPVCGVIEPSVAVAAAATRNGCVGVIGTKATIASQVYQSALQARGLTAWAQACPMLVHLVEEGLVDSDEAELLVRHYLKQHPEIDTLILGCTHYPFLRHVVDRVLGNAVTLVSCADAVSDLIAHSLNGSSTAAALPPGKTVHITTGDAAAYRHTSALIGADVQGEVISLDEHLLSAKTK